MRGLTRSGVVPGIEAVGLTPLVPGFIAIAAMLVLYAFGQSNLGALLAIQGATGLRALGEQPDDAEAMARMDLAAPGNLGEHIEAKLLALGLRETR